MYFHSEQQLQIRRMTLTDVDGVHAIETATFPKPWSREDFVKEMTQNACARYLVAEATGKIVGFAGAWIVLDEAHITNIAVPRPGYRPGADAGAAAICRQPGRGVRNAGGAQEQHDRPKPL